jgi:integrase
MKELEWGDVDLTGKVVRLRPEMSKNNDGRVLPLSAELLEIIERAKAHRRLDCQYVFHIDGEKIGDFKRSWATACKNAGVGKGLGARSPANRRSQHGHSGDTRSNRNGALRS